MFTPLQAPIEALDKRMRECAWAQRFCAAIAALQVHRPLPPLILHAHRCDAQAANEARDGSAAAAAARDAQQLLHAVQSEESFTMQVHPCPPPPPLAAPGGNAAAEQLARGGAGAGGAGRRAAVESRTAQLLLLCNCEQRVITTIYPYIYVNATALQPPALPSLHQNFFCTSRCRMRRNSSSLRRGEHGRARAGSLAPDAPVFICVGFVEHFIENILRAREGRRGRLRASALPRSPPCTA
jgi:hypothetical protein